MAGAGVIAEPADLTKWKLRRENAAGIAAGYGLEGFDMGPDWLAYVLVPGQTCMYNVWSSSAGRTSRGSSITCAWSTSAPLPPQSSMLRA